MVMSFEVTNEVILYREDNFDPQKDLTRLEEIWTQFATSQTIPVEHLRPSIGNSWERCRDFNVDPLLPAPALLTPEQVQIRLGSHQEYLEIVRPVIARIEKLVDASHYLIAFVDHEGYILMTYGDPQLRERLEDLNFRVGANWSERFAGTNAVGVALATGQPSQVFHAEHFCRDLHGFTCSAVPIRNPFSKQIIGVLDFVSMVQNFQPHTMGMALQMGHCIELEIYRSHKEQEEIFRECSTQLTLDQMQRGVIVVDKNRRIRRMNLTALEYLGLENDELVDRSIDEVPQLSKWLSLKGPTQITLSDSSPARLECKPLLHHRRLIGTLILIEPIRPDTIELSSRRSQGRNRTPVGTSPAFKATLEAARNAARYDSNVLIMGETGTGKEIITRYIHAHSPRRHKPFVAINCGSIPTELLGSELFGYEAGAFTGAKQKGHPSKFELADGGTLLLDEISEMPPESQVYLLRVIEERVVTRLGGTKGIPVDVRIIAASNKDLQEMVDAGRFRGDLFFRLNVIRLELPTLKERKADIPLLAEHFLRELSQSMGRSFRGFSPGVMQALGAYCWPGNVRELRNVIEQAMVMCRGDYITYESLPENIRRAFNIPDHVSDRDRERYLKFVQTYQELGGNISQVARALNISRPTVYAWRQKFGLG